MSNLRIFSWGFFFNIKTSRWELFYLLENQQEGQILVNIIIWWIAKHWKRNKKKTKKKTRSINPFKEYLKLIVKDIEADSFFGHWSVRFFGTWDLFGFHDLLNKGFWWPIFSNMTSILPNPDLYVSQFNIPLRIWALSNYGLKSLFIYKLISQVFPLNQVGIKP